MKKYIILILVFSFSQNLFSQDIIDSILYKAIKNHEFEIFDYIKNYSENNTLYVIYDENMPINKIEPDFKFNIVIKSKFEFYNLKKKDLKKVKIVLLIDEIKFENAKVVFTIVGGVLSRVKKKKLIQAFSTNIISIYFDSKDSTWKLTPAGATSGD